METPCQAFFKISFADHFRDQALLADLAMHDMAFMARYAALLRATQTEPNPGEREKEKERLKRRPQRREREAEPAKRLSIYQAKPETDIAREPQSKAIAYKNSYKFS